MHSAPLISRVRTAIIRARGRGVVVAVSGGGDSVGLLRVLGELRHECDLRLSVAHLDHGTRGEAGRADAAFVAEIAGTLGLPFDLGHWSPSRLGHFEADAREARYAWLVEVAKRRDAGFVAVGHTRDDQAETILHRILRGTGPKGLSGIPERRSMGDGVDLIRPLLDVSREEVRAYLSAVGQPFREDATNADLGRTRNRIRRDLLPKLAAEYNPKVVEALVRLGRLSRESRAWKRRIAIEMDAAIVDASEGRISLRGGPLRDMPPHARAEVLRQAWRRAGWPERGMTERHWLRLAEAVDRDGVRFSMGGGLEIRSSGGVLHISRSDSAREMPAPAVSLAIPGTAAWGEMRLRASTEPDSGMAGIETIDFDSLACEVTREGLPHLHVRGPRDGDRFDPLGLGGHTQALNDFLRGRGVAREDRCGIPLVCDRKGIVWVVGHRIAHRVRVTETTTRRLVLGATLLP